MHGDLQRGAVHPRRAALRRQNRREDEGYPLRRVAVLFVLTVLYLLFLETLGFYIGALLYFIAASLIAQPMKITPKLAAKRVAVCFVCIAFLYCLFTVLLAVQIPKGIFGI